MAIPAFAPVDIPEPELLDDEVAEDVEEDDAEAAASETLAVGNDCDALGEVGALDCEDDRGPAVAASGIPLLPAAPDLQNPRYLVCQQHVSQIQRPVHWCLSYRKLAALPVCSKCC